MNSIIIYSIVASTLSRQGILHSDLTTKLCSEGALR